MNTLKGATTHVRHAHMCENGHVWCHDYSDPLEFVDLPREYVSELERYNDAHHCPMCGSMQLRVYNGDKDIQFYFDGIKVRGYEDGEGPEPEIADRNTLRYRRFMRLIGDVLGV